MVGRRLKDSVLSRVGLSVFPWNAIVPLWVQETNGEQMVDRAGPTAAWPSAVYDVLKAAKVQQMAYVPDAGHTALINLFAADRDVTSTVLTTEEEGVAIAAGAWLGGQRTVLLMQSSGVGNCINMLSLPVMARFPLLMLVTMRGEWAEFNPWQVPMGRATQPALEAVGVRVMRADDPADLVETVDAAAALAYEADQQIAVLIGQRMIGKKKW
jgi:sulfopyruvate decarboxylase alpha subunit